MKKVAVYFPYDERYNMDLIPYKVYPVGHILKTRPVWSLHNHRLVVMEIP